MSAVMVRPYVPDDRAAVRRICCATALAGRSSALFFDDDEVFADALTRYFTDCEPQSAFVAEAQGKVVGYLIGAVDDARMGTVFVRRLLVPLLWRAFRRGTLARCKNIVFVWSCLKSALRGQFRQPSVAREYPAVLHINMEEAYRGNGTGERLIAAYTEYLVRCGVRGVHLATMSPRAGEFFSRMGFRLLYSGTRSYVRHVIGADIPILVYGKGLLS